MNEPIRILYVDDNPLDRELVRDALEKEHGGFRVTEANSRKDFETQLAAGDYDLVLSDFNILGFEGLQVLDAVQAKEPQIPVIIVTGTGSEEVAVEALKGGAADYVIKTPIHIRRLPQIIHAALEKIQMKEERDRLFNYSLDLLCVAGFDGTFKQLNPAWEKTLGWTKDELLSKPYLEFVHPDEREATIQAAGKLVAGEMVFSFDNRYRCRDGTYRWFSWSAYPLVKEGLIFAVVRDTTDRKRAERALEESEAKMRSVLDNIGIGVALISPRMEILDLNLQMREWFPAIDPGQHPICYRAYNDPPREAVCDYCPTQKTLRDGLVHEATTQTPQSGVMRNYRIVSSPIRNATGEVTAAIEMIEDITEKLSLEAQFQQAQKMEVVGRLAGGVAHDFNNMLGVILGHAELALQQVDPAQPLHGDLLEIRKAAQRSADLTRQLLAFARKQTVAPRVLDLNETVEGMLHMLRRLIGEDLDLVWLPGAGVWPVKVDPSQIDQILANLCVNARDALAGGGKITIETSQVTFDAAYCAKHAECVPGPYVLLAVSDDGCGMSRETLAHLFEPFFTTKGLGVGTGLGLATVYGIVKQNNGFIYVYSEPDRGTTFKIYLPRHVGKTEKLQAEGPTDEAGRGYETVLLVEDEPAILNLGRVMLERLGYQVLAAGRPGEAIRLAEEHTGQIHLLMTDVVMPEMNGRDLAKNLLSLYPDLKRLFMSGYTANVIAHHGVLDQGVHFIQKPFSLKELTAKVREALESE
jgi:PAS domain S-box-containing protein